MGMTFLNLKQADEAIMTGALKTAYNNLKEKQSQMRSPKKNQTKSARPATTAKPTRNTLQ